MKYRMMWEALKDTAEVMIADGIVSEVSWRALLDLMQQGEKMFEPEKRFSGTFLTEFVDALEFGFACLGSANVGTGFHGEDCLCGLILMI